jgi:hypothetical protein|tara:strand:+ start:1209 stop:1424 length:216 start_codon:yes stop_codon:yes gene_type:complete
MKVGDLVRVTFVRGLEDRDETATVGIFIRDDTVATGQDKHGDLIITRAFVLWDGGVYSTPLDQMEVLSESR